MAELHTLDGRGSPVFRMSILQRPIIRWRDLVHTAGVQTELPNARSHPWDSGFGGRNGCYRKNAFASFWN